MKKEKLITIESVSLSLIARIAAHKLVQSTKWHFFRSDFHYLEQFPICGYYYYFILNSNLYEHQIHFVCILTNEEKQ